jgi:hypothetical protein
MPDSHVQHDSPERRNRHATLGDVEKQQATQQAPEVRPLEVPMVPFAVVGIVVWAALGLLLLAFHGWVSAHGHSRWLWTCLAGVLWGLPGLYVMYRHDHRRR